MQQNIDNQYKSKKRLDVIGWRCLFQFTWGILIWPGKRCIVAVAKK